MSLIIYLPAAIYYSSKLYDRFKRRRLKGKNSDSLATGAGRILEITQREPSNRPPVILSIVLVACSLLILAFGGWAIYLWIVGRAAFRIDGWTILFLVFFVCAPIAVLVDTFFLEPQSYRLGRSWVFRDTDAQIDKQKRRVTIPRDMVMSLVSQAQSKVILHGRVKKHNVILDGSRVYAGTGGTALYVLDRKDSCKRVATLYDLKQAARLVDSLNNIHLFMLPTYPSDVPVEKVDINRFFTGLDNSRKHVMGGVYTLDGVKRVIKMA